MHGARDARFTRSSPDLDKATIDDIFSSGKQVRYVDLRCWLPWFASGILLLLRWMGVMSPLIALLSFGATAAIVLALDYCLCFEVDYTFDFDRWKCYPTMVLEFSELKKWYAEGRYTPYYNSDGGKEKLFGVIQLFLESVKPWQRVERIVRDVPAARSGEGHNYVVGGIEVTNAQQEVEAKMRSEGKQCVCLRTREIGRRLGAKKTMAQRSKNLSFLKSATVRMAALSTFSL